jgi:hypothetical protein
MIMIFKVPPYLLTAGVVGGVVVCGTVVCGVVVFGVVVCGVATVGDVVVTVGDVVVAALLHPISEEVPINKTSRTIKNLFMLSVSSSFCFQIICL